jgi:hypothetical protein
MGQPSPYSQFVSPKPPEDPATPVSLYDACRIFQEKAVEFRHYWLQRRNAPEESPPLWPIQRTYDEWLAQFMTWLDQDGSV